MASILRIPEKSGSEILLTYKITKSDAKLETAAELSFEVDGEKLDTPNTIIKALVSKSKPEYLGSDKAEQAQIEEWLSYTNQSLRGVGKKEIVSNIEKKLNDHLNNKTFFINNRLTIVDIVIFGLLFSHSKNIKVNSAPNTLRWFDLIQNVVIKVNNLTEDFPLVEINLDDVPEPAAPVAAKKANKKGADANAKKGADANAKKDDKKPEAAAAANAKDANKKGAVEGGKPKKEKKKAEKKPAPAPVESDQPVFSRIDIRVGYIKSCKKHEGADSLYVEEIDVGEEEPRTIVSGLVRWYPVEEMQNRYVLVLANLKPASMRGIKSYGMVLCASAADGSAVELLGPIDTSKVKPGDRVYVEGHEGEPEKVLNPKKKYWETVQPELHTNDDLIAHYGDKPLLIKTASGEAIQCKVATVKNGGIK